MFKKHIICLIIKTRHVKPNQVSLKHLKALHFVFHKCPQSWHTVGFIHKGPLGRVRDALPDVDGFWVAWIHGPHVLIVPPVSTTGQTETLQ